MSDLALSVLDRAWKHGKIYFAIVGLLTFGASFMGFQKLSDFTETVEQSKLDVAEEAEAARLTATEAQSKATEAAGLAERARQRMNSEIEEIEGYATGTRDEISSELSRIRTVVSQFEGETTQLRSEATEIVADIGSLRSTVEQQSRKLQDTDELVRSVVEGQKVEGFIHAEPSPRIAVVEQEGRKVSVYLLLTEAPLARSLRVQWHIFSQPIGSFGVIQGNLVYLRWADSASKLSQKPLVVEYFPDKGYEDPLFQTLEGRDGRAFADGQEIPLLFKADDEDP